MIDILLVSFNEDQVIENKLSIDEYINKNLFFSIRNKFFQKISF